MYIPFDEMPDTARVWVYSPGRFIDESQKQEILQHVKTFIDQWNAHGHPLRGSATIRHQLFLILAADESYNAASGCSIDSSVHFLKQLGQHLQTDFFDRTQQAFQAGDGRVFLVPMPELKSRIAAGEITPDTFTFNPQVATVGELKQHWLVPAAQSWLARYFRQHSPKVS
jgi:hypothetical protein